MRKGKIIKDSEVNLISGANKVVVGGCFDILHPGHFEFLKRAKAEGNTLILFLESDENIKRLKGNDHPVNKQSIRAKNLLEKTEVDYIVLLRAPDSNEYYYNLVKSTHPAIIAVTNNDPLIEVKKDQAKLIGGRVVSVMQRDIRYSSSALINKNK